MLKIKTGERAVAGGVMATYADGTEEFRPGPAAGPGWLPGPPRYAGVFWVAFAQGDLQGVIPAVAPGNGNVLATGNPNPIPHDGIVGHLPMAAPAFPHAIRS